MPESSSAEVSADGPRLEEPPRIRTVQELREQERANLILVLESSGWRVAGEHGAA
jgi:hypothetical protein